MPPGTTTTSVRKTFVPHRKEIRVNSQGCAREDEKGWTRLNVPYTLYCLTSSCKSITYPNMPETNLCSVLSALTMFLKSQRRITLCKVNSNFSLIRLQVPALRSNSPATRQSQALQWAGFLYEDIGRTDVAMNEIQTMFLEYRYGINCITLPMNILPN